MSKRRNNRIVRHGHRRGRGQRQAGAAILVLLRLVVLPLVLPTLGFFATASPARAFDPSTVRGWKAESRWRVFALEYARSRAIPARRLVRGSRGRVRMSWYFFLAVGHNRILLVDAGTDAFVQPGARARRRHWAVAEAVSVDEALGRVGVRPRDVTDVIVTHHHWDHTDGLEVLPSATVYSQAREWRHVGARVRRRVARRWRDIVSIRRDAWPDVEVVEAGRHTRHHLVVFFRCPDRTLALAGDAAYTYRNIVERRAVTVTYDPAGNVADVAHLVARVGIENVVPGHDPLVFERHPSARPGVAALCD